MSATAKDGAKATCDFVAHLGAVTIEAKKGTAIKADERTLRHLLNLGVAEVQKNKEDEK